MRPFLAAFSAAALAGCAFASSPADDLQFKAPAGWQSSPGIMGFMQFWRPAGSDQEVLMLFKSPKPLRPGEVFTSSDLQGSVKNVKLERTQTISICNGQPATLFQAEGTSSKGVDDRVDMVMSDTGGKTYFALYVRPAAGQSNAEALSALRELCAKR